MGRGLAAVALLVALLMIPAAAPGQAAEPAAVAERHAHQARPDSTDTGRRLDLPRSLMPRNKDGVPIDPTDMNRADGFSPGSMIIAKVPGLDNAEALAAQPPALARRPRGAASRKRSPVVVFNARTGKRHPVWAELDSNATSDANRVLIIRPAKNFTEGERYVVVLRNLKDRSGKHDQGHRNGRHGFERVAAQGAHLKHRGQSTASGRSPWRASAASRAACCTFATTPSGRSATPTCAT